MTINLNSDDKEIKIEAPLFILFGEYLGYISDYNKIAKEWCEGKVPDTHVQKLLILEAKCMFRQMKLDYTMKEIHDYFTMYYQLMFQEYDEKLKKLII